MAGISVTESCVVQNLLLSGGQGYPVALDGTWRTQMEKVNPPKGFLNSLQNLYFLNIQNLYFFFLSHRILLFSKEFLNNLSLFFLWSLSSSFVLTPSQKSKFPHFILIFMHSSLFMHEYILHYSNMRIFIVFENNLISTMLNNQFPFSGITFKPSTEKGFCYSW